jgi:hypothetical protein
MASKKHWEKILQRNATIERAEKAKKADVAGLQRNNRQADRALCYLTCLSLYLKYGI